MAPPPAKPKEPRKTNKKAAAKTNRTTRASNLKSSTVSTDGLKPEEAVEQLVKNSKYRAGQYNLLKAPMSFIYPECVIPKFLTKNPRMPVPFNSKRLYKTGRKNQGSEMEIDDYFSAQLVSMEWNEYYFVQAPTRESYGMLWRMARENMVKILVCMCHDDQMSATDDSKCYTYFPTEPNQQMEVEQKKGKYTITCKSRESLSMGAIKYEIEVIDSETPPEPLISDCPDVVDPRANMITVFHFNTWTGIRPEEGISMKQVENVASFLREIGKAETAILRHHMNSFVPPVILQSFDAIGRSSIAWVILMLLKDMEKRECFDVPDLIRKIMKMRPGSISNYYHYAFTYAVALQLSKTMEWCENDSAAVLDEFITKSNERKLNDVGNLAII